MRVARCLPVSSLSLSLAVTRLSSFLSRSLDVLPCSLSLSLPHAHSRHLAPSCSNFFRFFFHSFPLCLFCNGVSLVTLSGYPESQAISRHWCLTGSRCCISPRCQSTNEINAARGALVGLLCSFLLTENRRHRRCRQFSSSSTPSLRLTPVFNRHCLSLSPPPLTRSLFIYLWSRAMRPTQSSFGSSASIYRHDDAKGTAVWTT